MKNTEEFHFKPAPLPFVLSPRGEATGRPLQGSRGGGLCALAAALAGLCAALAGWQGGLRRLRRLRARGRFDRVQRFAKPRVFGSLDFVHKGSSLVFQLLRKQNGQNGSKPNELTKKHSQTQSLQSSSFLTASQALGRGDRLTLWQQQEIFKCTNKNLFSFVCLFFFKAGDCSGHSQVYSSTGTCSFLEEQFFTGF